MTGLFQPLNVTFTWFFFQQYMRQIHWFAEAMMNATKH